MQSLNLKWRPKCFAEVIGQPAIISILSKQIETKTFKNTYLFAGPSGCGKTTLARIMAKEINNNEGEPIEIDAASNNGVDNIRALISEAQQTSLDSDYKIFILDECHMLTTAAWNAALKLIEEPPVNSIFIFCTTNVNKIPDTILSRVQRFDFKKISNSDIVDRLEFILNEEGDYTFERDALLKIASKSNGYMREAISLLEKCTDFSKDVTIDNVSKVLGLIKDLDFYNLVKSLINKDEINSLNIYNNLKAYESNVTNLLDEFIKFLLEASKIQKLKEKYESILNEEFISYFKDLDFDIFMFVERAFKFRQISNDMDIDSLFNILILELCRR